METISPAAGPQRCAKCGLEVCNPCFVADNDNKPLRVIQVASDAELRSVEVIKLLARKLVALRKSRRQIPNWLSDRVYDSGLYIVWRDGSPFPLPDIDDLFGDDGSWRWLGSAMKFAEHGPKQLPQSRMLDRWRIIALAFKADNDNEP